MKFYIFPKGSLKLDNLELSEVVSPEYFKIFKEVSRANYYAQKTKEASKKAWDVTKKVSVESKRKALLVKDALKS